ncbi:flagellar protein FlaG [Parasalinivibrio latis]|uniref:flagellar protein FlaG n=1 Tax=Parasalinivibrio latis TaxID=2952610 RepID=UPI0030E20523
MDISSYSATSNASGAHGQRDAYSGGTNVARGKANAEGALASQQGGNAAHQAMKTESNRAVRASENIAKVDTLKRDQLEKMMEHLDEFVSSFNKGLAFKLDEDTGRSIITVYEKRSGQVIRQIPEEEVLELAKQLSGHASGLVTETV